MRCIRRITKLLSGIALASTLLLPTASFGQTTQPVYTSPTYFFDFGYRSHWLQPWRSYLETMPATVLVNGMGVNLNLTFDNSADPALLIQMLAKHGIRHARIEIGWNNIDYSNESQLLAYSAPYFQKLLLACKQYGVRPLILLNANHGGPTPQVSITKVTTQNAPAGTTTLTLQDTNNLIVGRSGLSNLSGYWAAEILITNIAGNTVTLSKPLPQTIAAGTSLQISTLKYRPFSPPGTADFNETMAGWNKYVSTVAQFVSTQLGTTTNQTDKGFDMEVWNELSFGSEFLYINHYYATPLYPNTASYSDETIWYTLQTETGNYVTAHPSEFPGVKFGDGLANTIPWPYSAFEQPAIRAIGKHPYTGRASYNINGAPDEGNLLAGYGATPLNALGQVDGSFGPAYTSLFPEYFATGIQTETMTREMTPTTNSVYGAQHGRYARIVNGQVIPCWTWITEVNISPSENGITNISQALAFKAKNTLRYFAFYLNKGVEQVDLFGAVGGDLSIGTIQDNFLQYASTNTIYPSDDTAYTSPALAATSRMVSKFTSGLDTTLVVGNTRSLTLNAITDTHNHYQFAGDGTAAHPNLYDRDVFAFLPFQVNAKRFVIPYYVMTRDVMTNLPPENFTLTIGGVNGLGARLSAYDPITNQTIALTVTGRTSTSLTVVVSATDYPNLLTIQER
ncbi:MAG: hypothetical protein H7Y37_06205 [Anaerolineae bacterium]|nr:hypothetical protein [Gloeobacterales cyanobacterium ES-bin-313]